MLRWKAHRWTAGDREIPGARRVRYRWVIFFNAEISRESAARHCTFVPCAPSVRSSPHDAQRRGVFRFELVKCWFVLRSDGRLGSVSMGKLNCIHSSTVSQSYGHKDGTNQADVSGGDAFDVIWSGAKQRAGECPGLSGYDNRKGIANAKRLALCAPPEWSGKTIA